MAKQLTADEQALFKQYMSDLKYPQGPNSQPGDAKNPVTQTPDYKNYPTAKNVPPSLKGGADQRIKATPGQLPGYTGDVLKADPEVREGKGVQYFTNGTVFDGYFKAGQFIKGRMYDQ